ncbi:unnamed protein product [Eruca vesicaria subsp. sativa]|uniref:RING-type E3 ubiquitin transferase n=1 Tax=Eruca vesicaria subsp. sativa TaxID=29727 RepID=A0ABC8JBS5_ERUVS|nr:unnamed protein product [Eruca vesicaria subsp. sativa]
MVRFPSEDGHAPVNSTVVAVDKDKNSHYAVRWAVDHLFNLINNSNMILVHISMREVILDDTDIAKAIIDYANNNLVNNIVLGSISSKNPFARSLKFTKSHDVAASVLKSTPEFCSVYVISKGKVQSSRAAQRTITNTLVPPRAPTFPLPNLPDPDQDQRGQRNGRNTTQERYHPHENGFNAVKERHKSAANGSLDFNYDFNQPMGQSQRNFDEPDFGPRMMGSIDLSAHNFDIIGASGSSDESVSQSNRDVEAEMRRLKLELKQTMDMYSSACKEALDAKQKANELSKWKLEEALRFEEARSAEEAARAVAETEKAKCKAAMEAAEKSQRMAELEGQRRKQAEMKARRESQEKDRALNALVQNDVRYRRYSIEEIEEATDRFESNRLIGEGGYGPVFKGTLDHTPVAIKVLRHDAVQGKKQFNQEVEVLSCIRHPHMVLLLGACPDYGCLVYEFMENGSLEDRLFRRGNSPPLSWRKRFQIAAEIATALSFLHQTKPEPLVHRDLKPANILLDRNYVSKISDVGLARLVPASVANDVTQYHMTSAAGTFCYIDPEYQQTGKLTTKSDVYSLGIMLLQIITAKTPMGLAHLVSRAISKGTFKDVLDPVVTDWPVEEAITFAKLCLKCAELRKKDRPDLGKDIVPELVRLRNFGMDNESL